MLFGFLVSLIGSAGFLVKCDMENRNAYTLTGHRSHPTGFALEYKTTYEKYVEAKADFENKERQSGYLEAVKYMRTKYKEYTHDGYFFMPDDIIKRYAIASARVECFKQNKWPLFCYSIRNVIYADTHAFDPYNNIVGPYHVGALFGFNEDEYQKLLAEDERNYEKAVSEQKRTGVWTGKFMTKDEYETFLRMRGFIK